MNLFDRKTRLLCSFRDYAIEEEAERGNLKDFVVTKRGEEGKILIRVVYKTRLTSDSVGVDYVRRMKKKMESEGYAKGILIGRKISYSARREATGNIEAIPETSIPSINIFEHYLVPKHEILSNEEAEELLKKFHVEPHHLPRIRVSDPAAFLIGAERGDIIKITRRSPTAGIHVTYRHVV